MQENLKISTVPLLTQKHTWNGSYNQGPSDEHKSYCLLCYKLKQDITHSLLRKENSSKLYFYGTLNFSFQSFNPHMQPTSVLIFAFHNY